MTRLCDIPEVIKLKGAYGEVRSPNQNKHTPCKLGLWNLPTAMSLNYCYRRVEQWPACQPHKLEVVGSNPAPATIILR